MSEYKYKDKDKDKYEYKYEYAWYFVFVSDAFEKDRLRFTVIGKYNTVYQSY